MLIRDIECKEYKYDSSVPLRVRIGCYGIVKNEEGKYLMIVTNKQQGLEFPGGGCEDLEIMKDCVIREVREESGFDVKLSQRQPIYVIENFVYSRSKQEYWKKIDFLFLCELKSNEEYEKNLDAGEEVLEMNWMSVDEMKSKKWIYFVEEHKENILQFL